MQGVLHLPNVLLVKLPWKKVLGAAAAAAVATGGIGYGVTKNVGGGGGGGGGGEGTANLWMDTNGGTCTRNATPAAYSDAAACSSMDAAYQAASGGDTIRMKAGSYGGESIQRKVSLESLSPACTTSNTTNCVTFTPDCTSVNCVVMDANLLVLGWNIRLLGNGARHSLGSSNWLIYYLNWTIDNLPLADRTRYGIGEGLHALTFFVTGARDITFKNSEVGPFLACYGTSQTRRTVDGADTICPNDPPYFPFGSATWANSGSTNSDAYEPKVGPDGTITNSKPTGVTLDGLYFHDMNSANAKNGDQAGSAPSGGASRHMGCLFLVSVSDFTLRNSIFRQCVVYDIQIQDFTTTDCCGQQYGPLTDFTFENNWFGQSVNGAGQTGTSTETVGGTACGTSFSCQTNSATNNQPPLQFDPRNVSTAPSPHNTTYWKDGLIRFNSFQGGFWWNNGNDTTSTFSNVRVIGNNGPGVTPTGSNCGGVTGLTYSYNAFSNTTCSDASSVLWNGSFVSTAITSADLHMATGANNADGLVTPITTDYALTTDIDATARTSGSRDAGSDER